MSEIIRLLIVCMVPVALFGMAAMLIYHGVPGWGWFLFCVILVVGSTSVNIK
jgi:hypothetical protein